MKFTLDNKPFAKVSTFDFEKAEEALAQSLSDVSDAYARMIACEGRCLEAEKVIGDLQLATESIQRFGVTATTHAIFNGDNGNLDKAIGIENMETTALESMTTASKAVLKNKYLASLEDASEATKKTFWERVKEWWNKFITYLKELFTSTARLTKMIEEAKTNGRSNVIDFDAKITGLKYDDAKSALDAMSSALEFMQNTANSAATVVGATKGTEAPELTKSEGSISSLGWDQGKLDTMAGQFISLVKDNKMKVAWDSIQKEYKQAQSQNSGDASWYDKMKDRFEVWRQAGKITSGFNRMARQVGFTLATIYKATKKAEAKKPAEEKK